MVVMTSDSHKVGIRFSVPTKEVSQPSAGLEAPRKGARGPVLP